MQKRRHDLGPDSFAWESKPEPRETIDLSTLVWLPGLFAGKQNKCVQIDGLPCLPGFLESSVWLLGQGSGALFFGPVRSSDFARRSERDFGVPGQRGRQMGGVLWCAFPVALWPSLWRGLG